METTNSVNPTHKFSFTVFSGRKSCPACEDNRGKCSMTLNKQEREVLFCHGMVDAEKGSVINGWKKNAVDSTGFWAIMNHTSDSNNYSMGERTEREIRGKLPSTHRHSEYDRIIRHLRKINSLDFVTSDLTKRGVTEGMIKKFPFDMIAPIKKFQEITDENLLKFLKRNVNQFGEMFPVPGFNPEKNTIIAGEDGYLIPAFNSNNEIIGMQLRVQNPTNGGKYRWLSSSDNMVVLPDYNDELPLTHIRTFCQSKSEATVLVEGIGMKPMLTNAFNPLYTVIGAAGGQHARNPLQLKEYLKADTKKFHNDVIENHRVLIALDAGDSVNPLMMRYKLETGKLVESWGYKVFYLDWGQLTKNQPDIDATCNPIQVAEHLTIEDFQIKYRSCFKGKMKEWYKQRQFTPDITINSKYFDFITSDVMKNSITLIKSPMGTGKTHWAINYARETNRKMMFVGHRNMLLDQIGSRARAVGLNAMHIDEYLKGIDADIVYACIDSHEKLDRFIQNNPDTLVVIDEFTAYQEHLITGGTLKKKQQKAMEWSINILQNYDCFLMDANMSDKNTDFITGLVTDKKIVTINNEYQVSPRTITFIESESRANGGMTTVRGLTSLLTQWCARYGKFVVTSTSKTQTKIIGKILQDYRKVLVVNSDTAGDEEVKEFMNNPDEAIISNQYDVIIMSPTAESGISIDIKNYFECVMSIPMGTLSINGMIQQLFRVRDYLPIYVFSPDFVAVSEDSAITNPANRFKVLYERAKLMCNEIYDGLASPDEINEIFVELWKQSDDKFLNEGLKDSVIKTFEHQNLNTCLKVALSDIGHIITADDVEATDEVKKMVSETRKQIQWKEANDIFYAEDISIDEALQISKKDTADVKKQNAIKKALFKHRLPDIERTKSWKPEIIRDLVVKDQKLIGKLSNYLRLCNKEWNRVAYVATKENIKTDINLKELLSDKSTRQVGALRLLGILELIEKGSFTCNDELARKICDKYYRDPRFEVLLGIKKAKYDAENGTHITYMIKKFLDVFGLTTKTQRRRKETSERETVHTIVINTTLSHYITDLQRILESKFTTLEETVLAKEIASKIQWKDKPAEYAA